MANAFVSAATPVKDTSGSTFTVRTITLPGNWVAGNAVWFEASWLETATENFVVTDAAGNSFTSETKFSNSRTTQYAWCKNLTGTPGTTFTLTWNSAISYYSIECVQFSGQDTTTQPDVARVAQQVNNVGSGTDAITSGNMTTVTNGCMIFSTDYRIGSGLPLGNTSAGTGFTSLGAIANGVGDFLSLSEYRIQATAGSVAGTFTENPGSSQNNVTAIAFRPAAAAGSRLVRPKGMNGGQVALTAGMN